MVSGLEEVPINFFNLKFLMNRIYSFLILFLSLSFSLNAQTVTLLFPNGGEVWPGASQQDIEWNSFNVDNIKIEYSIDNGATWELIINSYPTSALKYSWTIPIQGSADCRVRISDILDGDINDISNSAFTIPASSITITSPNGGENLTRGELKVITWNSVSIDQVKIEFSDDNGLNWTTIQASHPALLGYYNWPVPAIATTQGLVRLSRSSDPSVSDNSNSNFTVTVPPVENTNTAKYHGGSYDGYSMGTNVASSISIINPDGAETLNGSTIYYIKWVASNVTNIKIEFTDDDGANWSVIEPNISVYPNSYPWSVPATTSSQCRIRITDIDDPSVADQSTNLFSIIPALLDLISPIGGEIAYTGMVIPITWTSSSVVNLKIEYSPDYGITWITSESNYPASRKYYNWTAPQVPSDQVIFRISDASDLSTSDATILPVSVISLPASNQRKYHGGSYDGYSMVDNFPASITLLTPDGGQILNGNAIYNITWVSSNVDNIKIEFSHDDGNTWSVVVPNLSVYPNSYSWSIPTTPSSQCRIRISDVSDNSITDQSGSTFTIVTPLIQITSPLGGENIYGGSVLPITWASMSVTNVKIEYSLDNGINWNVAQASYAANNGIYNWSAPDSPSSLVRIRISDVSNVNLSDTTDAVSVIAPLISDVRKYHGGSFDGHAMSHNIVTILSPNGNEVLEAGSTHTIAWVINENTNLLSLYSVKIEYSTDSGVTWNIIEAAYDTDASTYDWSIPDNPSSLCKVRVTNLNTGSDEDVSDNLFEISSATSVLNKVKNDFIRVIPNPSSGTLFVELPGSDKLNWIRVYNLLGEELYFEEISSVDNFYLHLEKFPEGVYLLKGDMSGKTIHSKFIIRK